jgi:hypothetical protein
MPEFLPIGENRVRGFKITSRRVSKIFLIFISVAFLGILQLFDAQVLW